MKGIILAGGLGTRLYPLTRSISKQILPVYDKPMIYYPLSTLLMANIKEILIISTPRDIYSYQQLLGDGSSIGINLSYIIQEKPGGIAEAFIVGEEFIKNDSVALILGDNVFCGERMNEILNNVKSFTEGAMIFGYYVENPKQFGVVEIDSNNKVISLVEKPSNPKSNLAIPGIYFYDNMVIDIAKNMKPSLRYELEITDVNKTYHEIYQLQVRVLENEIKWFDTGTCDGLLEAANYIYKTQKATGKYIGCIEEIAYLKGYISYEQLQLLAKALSKTEYGKYILNIAER